MRSKIILAAALLMGLVTTVLFFDYMKKFDAAHVSSDTLVRVVAAKQAIPENTLIAGGMLQMIEVPAKSVHPGAIKSEAAAEGKVAAADLAPNEVLLENHVKSQQEEALFVSKKVQDGYRAVTVGVNLVQSVSNLIEPDDTVDVVSTPTGDKQPGEKLISSLLLENVRVLAIGRRMVEATAQTPYAEYSTVTLEVKLADAVNVINADERGDINLVLHSRVTQATPSKEATKQ